MFKAFLSSSYYRFENWELCDKCDATGHIYAIIGVI